MLFFFFFLLSQFFYKKPAKKVNSHNLPAEIYFNFLSAAYLQMEFVTNRTSTMDLWKYA